MWRDGMQAEAYVYASAAHESGEYKKLPSSHFNATYGDSIWRGELEARPVPAPAWCISQNAMSLVSLSAISDLVEDLEQYVLVRSEHLDTALCVSLACELPEAVAALGCTA